jgi:hypothetical protein
VLDGKFIQDHITDDRKMTLIAVETSVKATSETRFDEMKVINENEEDEESKDGNPQQGEEADKSRTPNSYDDEHNSKCII